jgi:pimeloyl-ACP methyl ester carboxylesterase
VKKILIYVFVVIGLIIIFLPVLAGDLEKEVLNEQTRSTLPGSFIKLSDGYTHYELKGTEDAKTILLVHGNAAPCCTWDNNYNELVNAGFRVLRYDIYGHGFSDRPDYKEYSKDLYDRQIIELLDKLNIKDPIYLAGTSQGGCVCGYFITKHPEKVEKLALLSPLYDFKVEKVFAIMKSKIVGEYYLSVFGDKFFTDPSRGLYTDDKKEELTRKLEQQIHYKGKKKAVLANLRGNALDNTKEYYEQIRNLNIPLLLTWGENDKSIPRESIESLRQLNANIQYHEIKYANHLAHYEFSEQINKILIDFFKD